MPAKIELGETLICVYISGEIDHHNAGEMRGEIDDAIQRNLPQLVRMDFSAVEFMDSSGIGLVLGRYKLLQSTGGKLEVINMPGHIKKVMQLAGIDKLGVFEKAGGSK